MIRDKLNQVVAKIDAMSLRERTLIFLAAAFLVVSLIDSLLLSPLLAKQKNLSGQVEQQQERMKALQAQIVVLIDAKQADTHSPQRERVRMLRQQLADGEAYLKERRDNLVPPEQMAALLEQVLNKNKNLQLVALNTLPPTLFIEPAGGLGAQAVSGEKQVFKHGVQLVVRGSYADLLHYLTVLEGMPAKMYWGMARLEVVQHPVAELTLTLYTLSLDKSWLQV